MKKFSFRLEKVLTYKDRILDGLKNEHAKILMDIRNQEDKIARLKEKYLQICEEYDLAKAEGTINIEKLLHFEYYLKNLDEQIKKENEILDELMLLESKNREEVVKAKQDVQALEKLKENKIREYNKELTAAQELVVEEFITNRMTAL